MKLDDEFLDRCGLSKLPVAARRPFLQLVYDTLEERVGVRVADQMSDTQLDEFEELIDGGDEDEAQAWLDANLPGYRALIDAVQEELIIEITSVAPRILALESEPESVR